MAKFLSKDGKFYMRDGKLLQYTPPPAPTLAANNSWYKGSTAKSTITAIEIKDSYTPTGTITEQWNADVDDSGSIKAYIEGTKLTIAGNGAEKIMANADSSYAFSDIDGFSKVTAISGLDMLDTSKVTNMVSLFQNCEALTSVGDLSGWNTANVMGMNWMFNNCTALTSLDVSGWNTSNVTGMRYMFFNCSSLTNLDLSDWNTSNVTNIERMFYKCSSLTSLDLSGWDTSNVTDMSSICWGCLKLQEITLGKDFKFVDASGYLPTPSSSYITGADRKWYDTTTGTGYTTAELAAVTRTETRTYTAIPPTN